MPKCQREWKIRRVGNEDDYAQQLKGKQELLLTKILRLSKLKIKKKMLGHWLKCLCYLTRIDKESIFGPSKLLLICHSLFTNVGQKCYSFEVT